MTTERGSYDDAGMDPLRTDDDATLAEPIAGADTTLTGTPGAEFAGSAEFNADAAGAAGTTGYGGYGGSSAGGASGYGAASGHGGSSADYGTVRGGGRPSTTQGSGDRLGEAAGGVVGRAGDTIARQADRQLGQQLDRGGDMLHQVARAVRDAGDQVRDQQPQLAGFADTAAQQVDRAAQYLHENDVRDVVHEVENLARRQPALFLGGAFVLGALAARFLKASSPQGSRGGYGSTPRRGYDGAYGSSYGGASSYGAGGSYGDAGMGGMRRETPGTDPDGRS